MRIPPISTWRDRLPSFVDRLIDNAVCPLTRSVTRLDAQWRGIAIGKGCRFHGRPILRRSPGSGIIIGAGSVFRSSQTSNLGGVNRPCYICTNRSGARIEIADSCGFSGTVICAEVEIVFGKNVWCGVNTLIIDTDGHPVDAQKRLAGESGGAIPIRIEDNAWLGMNVVVLKGVTIGRNSVVAANSVVTNSIPANVIAAGYPARVVQQIVPTSPGDQVRGGRKNRE
jgi:acetyltransferase-like isoleucine patch superfamily enzyme